MMFWSKDQSMMMLFLCWWCFWSKDQSVMMMFLIERSECDDDYVRQIRIWWWWCCCWSKGQGAEDVVVDRKVKMLKMLLLIEKSKCWRCCWSKVQNAEDVVADRTSQSAEDVADRKFKMLKMLLLIEPVKVLKMLLIKKVQVLNMSLQIERSKCWRCWWWWRLKIEDEDFIMLKSFQWFIDVLPCWCWWCLLSLLLLLLM